jgi:hypothetical protein
MNIAGGRDLVLENGPDTMNSSDEESATEEHSDVLTGMYTAGLKAPVVLSQSEVARQRASAEYFRKVRYGNWINSDASSSNVSSEFESSQSQSARTSPVPYRSVTRNPFLPSSDTGASSDACASDAFAQYAPTSPASTRCGSRFETPEPSGAPESVAPMAPSEPAPRSEKGSAKRSGTGKVAPPRAATPVSVPQDPPSPKRSGKGK